MNASVSIIIPVYNSQKYLGLTLDSVFEQTWNDFEIIVVDDGSSDGSQSLVEKYINRYPNKIRLVSQENGGAAKARNTGLGLARGEFIAFIDSDDIWQPDKLRIQMEYFEKNSNISLVYTNAVYIDASGKNLGMCYSKPDEFGILPDKLFDRVLMRNFVPFSSVIVKKAVIDKVGNFNINYGNTEDMDFILRILHDFQGFGINKDLVKYRIHDNNVSNNMILRHQNALEILFKFTSQYPEIGNRLGSKLKERFSKKHFEYGYALFENENFYKARIQFLNSIKTGPFQRLKKYFYYLMSTLPIPWIRYLRSIKRSSWS